MSEVQYGIAKNHHQLFMLLGEHSAQRGVTLNELRLERQARYERMFLEQSRGEAASADTRADPPRRTGQETGGQ